MDHNCHCEQSSTSVSGGDSVDVYDYLEPLRVPLHLSRRHPWMDYLTVSLVVDMERRSNV